MTTGQRICGDCQLCCRLLPVSSIDKKAGKTCQHQRRNGCAIYSKRPMDCELWSCAWLLGAPVARPHEAGYVVDPVPDAVTVTNNETGEQFLIPATQVWVDPKHRDAHRCEKLRAYLSDLGARYGSVAIVRYSSNEGFTLVPPTAPGADGKWHEAASKVGGEHSPEKAAEAWRGK